MQPTGVVGELGKLEVAVYAFTGGRCNHPFCICRMMDVRVSSNECTMVVERVRATAVGRCICLYAVVCWVLRVLITCAYQVGGTCGVGSVELLRHAA